MRERTNDSGRHGTTMRLGILGGGRAAWAFGSTWRRLGWPISGVWLRRESTSAIAEKLAAPRQTLHELAHDSDLILVAVSDRAIAEVAGAVPESPAVIFHASGSLTHVRQGFSLHPLRALPAVGTPSDLRDTLLVFEGNHRELARHIADAAGARFAEVDAEQKALYHAAAVFGSNYVAAMLDIARELMARAGIEQTAGDLVSLALSAMENWREHEDARRFTGPAARGDREVLARHLASLHADPQLAELYRVLAARIGGDNLATDE